MFYFLFKSFVPKREAQLYDFPLQYHILWFRFCLLLLEETNFIKCEERNLCCPHFMIGLDVGSLGSGLGVTMKTKSIYLVVNVFSSVVLLLNLVLNMLC
jgi:hypothetical protein